MHAQAEGHEHPRQPRRCEDEDAQKAEAGIGVAAGPDVDEGAGEGGAQKGQRRGEGAEGEEGGRGIEKEPRKGGGRRSGALLEEARVSLEEEDVEEQVERGWSEVDEGGQEPPVLAVTLVRRRTAGRGQGRPDLGLVVDGTKAVEQLEGSEHSTLDQDRGNDGRGRPVASAGRHLKKPLFQRELADLAHTAVATSKEGRHDPRDELNEGEERAVEILQERGCLEDAVDRTENALAQNGRP